MPLALALAKTTETNDCPLPNCELVMTIIQKLSISPDELRSFRRLARIIKSGEGLLKRVLDELCASEKEWIWPQRSFAGAFQNRRHALRVSNSEQVQAVVTYKPGPPGDTDKMRGIMG